MAKEFEVQGLKIAYKKIDTSDYISLTDLAKYKNEEIPAHVISHWISTKFAIEFMGIWEKMNNPNFNLTEFREVKNESGGSFTLSPKQWIAKTNAIGLTSSTGRYGGTYAHKDIAFEFATWISAEFKYWIIQEFQRLKETELKQFAWSAKRELAKINYRFHTDAIKEHIVPTLSPAQLLYVYATEADLLNVAMFGETAAMWREENPELKGNIRDYATIEQLLVLANMESYNSILIEQNHEQSKRLSLLNAMAASQLKVLQTYDTKLLSDTGKDL